MSTKIEIRLARQSDLKKYTDLHQTTYQDAYTNEDLGITKDLFSKEVFGSPDNQQYLASNLEINDNQRTWLAFSGSELVGSITITHNNGECEFKGFYVRPKYQGKGVGKKLWRLALKFAGGKVIALDIYAHNKKTIQIYKKWGFEVDKEKGAFYRHWPEWPENIKVKSIYMRYKQKK